MQFERPSKLADAAGTNAWDIGLIGAEPARAEKITFTAGLLRDRGDLSGAAEFAVFQTVADVDRAGSRIAVRRGSAYDLWLARNIKHATVLRSDTADGPFNQFVAEKLDALAGSAARNCWRTSKSFPAPRILPGNFTAVQQAIGTVKSNTAGAAFLREFVAEAKRSGLVARLIEKHHVVGLSVAP